MINDHRLIMICSTMLAVSVIIAFQFRYKTYNKAGWNTAVFDRWTGEMSLCGTDGCISQDELEDAAKPKPDPIYAELYDGTKLKFLPVTEEALVDVIVKKITLCKHAATSQNESDQCAIPSRSRGTGGMAYEVLSHGTKK